MFKSSDEEAKRKALEMSPSPIGSKMIFLRPWSPEIKLIKEELQSVSMWVTFLNLKLHYYTAAGLSKLANYLGKPLFSDKQTASQERVSYARICIEMTVGANRPRSIHLVNEFGEEDIQEVKYDWIPPSCIKYQIFDIARSNAQKIGWLKSGSQKL